MTVHGGDPLVSVITPSYQQARWLGDNLRSVARQTYPNIEHIVVDGGSTDGSVELLRRAAGPRVRWSSEPDRGQSAAINKAFRSARGSIIGWLNSDDAYFDRRAVEWAVQALADDPGAAAVYGHAALVNADDRILHGIWVPPFDARVLRWFNFIVQPTVFLRRSALPDDHLVDERYDSMMDRELWLRLTAEGRRFIRVGRILAVDRHQPGRKVYARPELAAVDLRRIEQAYELPRGAGVSVARKAMKIAFRLIGVELVTALHRADHPFEARWDGTFAVARRQVATPRARMALEDAPVRGALLPAGVVICQTAFGDYREAFLRIIRARLGEALSLHAGREYFDSSTRTRISADLGVRPLGNHFLFGRRLLWQSGAVGATRYAGVAIVEFNPRILSAWLSLIVRRLAGRPSLLWGHAWSRSGPDSHTEPLRWAMRRLASGVIVYTETQARELRERDPRARVFVAPNALYRANQMRPAVEAAPVDAFLFVGRLVKPKRPDLLLEAFLLVTDQLRSIRLVFIGDGPLRVRLEDRAAGSTAAGRVSFLGHVGDPDELRRAYAAAIASVSPGFVGLSITQSLGFGVPMIIARQEPHSPEIEAAREGWNAVLYSPSTAHALSQALVAVAERRTEWIGRREEISQDCRARYSAEAMADGLLKAVSEVRRGA